MNEKELRNKLSLLIANYFRRHLEDEIEKKEELINNITLEGISFKESTLQLISELEIEFPELKNLPEAPYNLFLNWNIKSRENQPLVKDYFDSTYKMYNQNFMFRLRDYKYGSKESKEALKKRVGITMPIVKFYGSKVNFSVVLQSENFMREELRNILEFQNEIPIKEAYELILEQTNSYSNWCYEYFDGLLQDSYDRTDSILKRTLPEVIAEELKQNGKVKPLYIQQATVLFTDFTGFTSIAEKMEPEVLLNELDYCFSKFDSILEKYKLEKIKTIGDGYLCSGGIFSTDDTYILNTALASKEILEFILNRKLEKEKNNFSYWDIRIGIHIGPIVAGVIGEKRFSFDIWGDTVNTASRIESNSEPNKINVSEKGFELLKNYFHFEPREPLHVKGKGKLKMYFLGNQI